jgi:hypothetical protein
VEANKCWNCGKYGHLAKDCRLEKKYKGKKDGKGKGTEESNMGEEHIAFTVNEEPMDVDEELYNFDTFDECNAGGIDERLVLYDWLADSATTSHITYQREAFTSYTPLGKSSITGVGGNQATIAGQGTVELVSTCNGQEFILLLQNVLYVPGTRNNLISLGRWDTAGGRYIGGGGTITLITKDGKHIAQGTKVNNNLYKMKLTTRKPHPTPSKTHVANPLTFIGSEPACSWETWHR